MAARLLRQRIPNIRITESHPKALLWLLKVAKRDLMVADVTITHLNEFITDVPSELSDHQRDAALGAIAAWAMINKRAGWRDLFDEKEAFAPAAPVEYWMPIQ